MDDFPTTSLVIPTVSLVGDTLERLPFELGNRTGKEPRVWYIDVFGKNKAQRDDYGYRILNNIEDGIPVYNYDEGFPPDVSPTQLGILVPQSIRMKIIRVIPELVEKLYWRSTISFEAIFSNI